MTVAASVPAGSRLLDTADPDDTHIEIRVGSLDEAPFELIPEDEIWVKRRESWIPLVEAQRSTTRERSTTRARQPTCSAPQQRRGGINLRGHSRTLAQARSLVPSDAQRPTWLFVEHGFTR
jgi:hypothetical protein